MAQSTIKKGFFFYFGMFAVIVVTVFLISLVIMMFNPGETVLWMKYFTSTGTPMQIVVCNTEDQKDTIDYSKLEGIVVNCGYSDVVVQKNKKYNGSGIWITNSTKGFAGHKSNTEFTYTVSRDSENANILNITVHEPEGFLFFSNNIVIDIASDAVANDWNLNNISVTVNSTGDGDIEIGGTSNKEEELISLKSLSIDAKKSDIYLNSTFNTQNCSNLSLVTESGRIASNSYVDTEQKKTGIKTNCKTKIVTSSGKINLNTVNVGDNVLTLGCRTGSVSIDSIVAKSVSVDDTRGNFIINNIQADVNFGTYIENVASGSIESPYFNAGTIDGNFCLASTDEESAPEIHIDKVKGDFTVHSQKGNVVVNSIGGKIDIVSGDKMSVNVVVASENTDNSVIIDCDSGDVVVTYAGNVTTATNQLSMENDKGTIEVKITNKASFIANLNNDFTDDNNKAKYSNTVNVNVDGTNVNVVDSTSDDKTITKNFNYGTTDNTLNIKSNGKSVTFTLIAV